MSGRRSPCLDNPWSASDHSALVLADDAAGGDSALHVGQGGSKNICVIALASKQTSKQAGGLEAASPRCG